MNAAVAVRVADPADEAAVTALLRASYPVLMRPAYEPATLAAALPLMARANPGLLKSGTFYVAAADTGAVVGCGGWTHHRPGSAEVVPGLAHLRHFASHPDHAGRGVGRAIFAACRSAAREAGVTRLECYASLNAEGFYAALGLSPVRLVEVPMGSGLRFPSVVMQGPV